MELQDAIEEVKAMSGRDNGEIVRDDIVQFLDIEAIATILNAVVKGELK